MDIAGLDPATARLVVELRLEDITNALETVTIDNGQTATFRALRRSLQDQLQIMGEESDEEEDEATDDDKSIENTIESTAQNVVSEIEVAKPEEIEPRTEPEPEPEVECFVNEHSVPAKDALELDCRHIYCRECITDLCHYSVHKDSTLFPPQCCKEPIPYDKIRTLISMELMAELDAKREEYDRANTIICSGRGCRNTIAAEKVEASIATCGACATKTCTTCKDQAHTEGLCPVDEQSKRLMATAGVVGWQKCNKCKNMVELDVGCFHIVCRCGYQFCYLCAEPWKTCRCPQFDEQHLIRPTPADVLEEAPIVCQHAWVQHDGTSCANCEGTEIKSAMRCSKCNVENCMRCIHNRA